MIYKVEYSNKVKYIMCSRTRIHYVAQELAGYTERKSKKHGVRRIPRKYTITRMGRLGAIQDIARGKSDKAPKAKRLLQQMRQA